MLPGAPQTSGRASRATCVCGTPKADMSALRKHGKSQLSRIRVFPGVSGHRPTLWLRYGYATGIVPWKGLVSRHLPGNSRGKEFKINTDLVTF